MIGDDQQQQDDQQEPVLVLGEDYHPPAVVNVDGSEDFLAAHISRDKKTLFGCQWVYKTALYGHSLILVQAVI